MKPTESSSSAAVHIGHVKNGVIVLESPAHLREGQSVRIEPIEDQTEARAETDQADRVRQLQQLFAEWTEEDGQLSDEEADRLRAALEQSRGVSFRSLTLD